MTVDSFHVLENESAINPSPNNSISVIFDKDLNVFQKGFTDSGVIMDKFDIPESENAVARLLHSCLLKVSEICKEASYFSTSCKLNVTL